MILNRIRSFFGRIRLARQQELNALRAGVSRRRHAYAAAPPSTTLDWGWLKVERHWHTRYNSAEFRVVLKLPLPRRVTFSFNYDGFATGKPALIAAFGRIDCSEHGFHFRGDRIYVDQRPLSMAASLQVEAQIKRGEKPRDPGPGPYPDPAVIGHKNPINLANYDGQPPTTVKFGPR